MKITKTWLKNRDACVDGYEWFLAQKTTDFETLFHLAMKAGRYPDINWVITKKMNKKQRVQYAIYSAELVLKNFESKYPNDDRPRKAIEVAKEYLNHPSESARSAASSAAWSAERAARIDIYKDIVTFGFKFLNN